jgi:mannose-6-phosphate isomerase
LSIQVHPDDDLARTMGEPNGKTEAWHILSAEANAAVGIGLTSPMNPSGLRDSIVDGTIASHVRSLPVESGETLFVPAGTIHVIGAGLILAEIQQRSDTTYRLYDQGRGRPLDIENGIASALGHDLDGGVVAPRRLADVRTLLVACPYFVLEKIDVRPDSNWILHAETESWLFVISGSLRLGRTQYAANGAVYLDKERAAVRAGPNGFKALIAYAASAAAPELLLEDITRPAESLLEIGGPIGIPRQAQADGWQVPKETRP